MHIVYCIYEFLYVKVMAFRESRDEEKKEKRRIYNNKGTRQSTECPNKNFPVTPGSILSQSQAFSSESNQSQSSIHVNIMVPGVTGKFFLGHPVHY